MRFLRNPFTDGSLFQKVEISLLRAYLIFDIAQRLVILAAEQARETGIHLGLW